MSELGELKVTINDVLLRLNKLEGANNVEGANNENISITNDVGKIIKSGFVLEAYESDEAGVKSYDDMTGVGMIRLSDSQKISSGDDLDDTPFNCNGDIYDGEVIALEKGDFVIIIKGEKK